MKVIIIGGGGNIGLAGVVPALIRFGHKVTIVSRSSTVHPGCESIRADYRDSDFPAVIRQGKFDAAISMITFNTADAEILLRLGVGQIVFISTVCVMGGPLKELPASETTQLAPITRYGIDKLGAEIKLLNQRNTPVTIFRPASTVGPRFPILRQLAVDSSWIYRLKHSQPIVLADDGLQLWSWCSSEDAGVPIAASIGREKCFHQTYILTRPDPISWLDYHSQVAKVLGVRPELVLIPSDAIIASGLECQLLKEQSRWPQHYNVSKLLADFPEFAPATTFDVMVERCLDHLFQSESKVDEAQNETENNLIRTWTGRINLASCDIPSKTPSQVGR